MSTAGTAPSTLSSSSEDDDVQRVVVVYNCSRLGLTANPPGFSFGDLFRFGRRRRR
jgi:hypothetical protein